MIVSVDQDRQGRKSDCSGALPFGNKFLDAVTVLVAVPTVGSSGFEL